MDFMEIVFPILLAVLAVALVTLRRMQSRPRRPKEPLPANQSGDDKDADKQEKGKEKKVSYQLPHSWPEAWALAQRIGSDFVAYMRTHAWPWIVMGILTFLVATKEVSLPRDVFAGKLASVVLLVLTVWMIFQLTVQSTWEKNRFRKALVVLLVISALWQYAYYRGILGLTHLEVDETVADVKDVLRDREIDAVKQKAEKFLERVRNGETLTDDERRELDGLLLEELQIRQKYESAAREPAAGAATKQGADAPQGEGGICRVVAGTTRAPGKCPDNSPVAGAAIAAFAGEHPGTRIECCLYIKYLEAVRFWIPGPYQVTGPPSTLNVYLKGSETPVPRVNGQIPAGNILEVKAHVDGNYKFLIDVY